MSWACTWFISAQNHWSLLERGAEAEVVPAARCFGVGVLPYSPLANGLLTGRLARQEPPRGTRLADRRGYITEEKLDRVEALISWAQAQRLTFLDVAIGGLAAIPGCASVIAGAMSTEARAQRPTRRPVTGSRPPGSWPRCAAPLATRRARKSSPAQPPARPTAPPRRHHGPAARPRSPPAPPPPWPRRPPRLTAPPRLPPCYYSHPPACAYGQRKCDMRPKTLPVDEIDGPGGALAVAGDGVLGTAP